MTYPKPEDFKDFIFIFGNQTANGPILGFFFGGNSILTLKIAGDWLWEWRSFGLFPFSFYFGLTKDFFFFFLINGVINVKEFESHCKYIILRLCK